MEYNKILEASQSKVYSTANGRSQMGQPQMGQPQMGQPQMNNRAPFWYTPTRPFPSMDGRMPMGNQPYPVFPPNTPMPYFWGQPMGGGMLWNENELTEEDLDRELEQIMEMYPQRAREIQRRVMELCDSIDYDGSVMYDEYPDRLVLRRYCDKLFSDMEPEDMEEELEMESVDSQDVSEARRQPCRNCRRNDGGRDLIDVLFFNEMFRRRRRRKGRQHRW